MKINALTIIHLLLLASMTAGAALAVPSSTQNILVNYNYAPNNASIVGVNDFNVTGRICIRGDCQTAWPTGGGSGTGNASITNSAANRIWYGNNDTSANATGEFTFIYVPTMGNIRITGSASGGTSIDNGISGSNRGESSVYRIVAYARPLEFMTSSSNISGQRMVIDASGFVHVGPTVTSSTGSWIKNALFTVNGSSSLQGNVNITGNTTFLNSSVGIGVNAPVSSLEVAGDVVIKDSDVNWTSRGQLNVVDSAGNNAIGLIRSNSSYVTIGVPGGTPTTTRVQTTGTVAQHWIGATHTGTTYSSGDTAFGSDVLNPIFFVDADNKAVCVNCNTTTGYNFTVNGISKFSGNVTNTLAAGDRMFVDGQAVASTGTQTNFPFSVDTVAIGADANYGYIQNFNSKPLFLNPAGNKIVTGSGQVGINTTSTDSSLQVVGHVGINASTSGAGLNITNTLAGRSASLRVNRPGVGGVYIATAGGSPASAQIGVEGVSGTQTAPINLHTASSGDYGVGDTTIGASGAGTTQPTLFVKGTTAQTVGINTSSPNATLHVIGVTNTTRLDTATICLSGNCTSTWPGGAGGSYDDTGVRTNISDLQSSNTSTNTRISTINTTVQNLLTSNTSVYALVLQLGQNDTNLNASINAVNTRATSINATASTALQIVYGGSGITVNASGTGVTVVASASGGNLSTTGNGSTNFLPVYTSASNVNSSGYWSSNDTGRFYNINGTKMWQVNTDGTQNMPGSAVFPGRQFTNDDDTGPYGEAPNVYAITEGGNAGGGKALNVSRFGLKVVNNISSGANISADGYVNAVLGMKVNGNAVLTNVSSIDFGQITGYNTALVNTTLLNATNSPSTGQTPIYNGTGDLFTWVDMGTGSGSGNVTGTGATGQVSLFTSTGALNGSGIYQSSNRIIIGATAADTGHGGQQLVEISQNGPRAQLTINDNGNANGTALHLRTGTDDLLIRTNSSVNGIFVENETGLFPFNVTQYGAVSTDGQIYVRGNPVLTNASSIDFSQITGYNTALVNTTLLNATNSPTPGDCATAASGDQFTWASCGTGGGGGNVTGVSNASGSLAMWNSTTQVVNSSVLITSLGDVYLGRNLFFRDYGSDQTIRFNGSTGAPGIDWIRSTNQLRVYGGTGGAGTIQMYGQTFDYNGHENVTQTLYSDSVNRTMRIDNTGNEELWLNLAPDGGKVGVNHTVTATSKALTVIGEMNVSDTVYFQDLVSCDTIDTDATGKLVCGSDSGGGGGGNISGGSLNGTAGYVATFNATTTINASTLYVNPTTGAVVGTRFLGKTGGASTPLFSILTDADSGYDIGSGGESRFYDDGVLTFQSNSDGIQVPDGSGCVFPGIQSTGDDDTGVCWPAANKLALTVAGNAGGGIIMNVTTDGVSVKALCQYPDSNPLMPCRSFQDDPEAQRRFMVTEIDTFVVGGAETGEYGTWGWTTNTLPTGGDVTSTSTTFDVKTMGVLSLGSGTVIGTNVSISTDTSTSAGFWINGSSGINAFYTRVASSLTGHTANNYTTMVGFTDVQDKRIGVDAVIAMYNSSESVNWILATCNTNVCSKNTSSVQWGNNSFADIEVQVWNNTQAVMFINGTLAATLHSNLPSGSGDLMWAGSIRHGNTNGTTESRLYVDYYGVAKVFNEARY